MKNKVKQIAFILGAAAILILSPAAMVAFFGWIKISSETVATYFERGGGENNFQKQQQKEKAVAEKSELYTRIKNLDGYSPVKDALEYLRGYSISHTEALTAYIETLEAKARAVQVVPDEPKKTTRKPKAKSMEEEMGG